MTVSPSPPTSPPISPPTFPQACIKEAASFAVDPAVQERVEVHWRVLEVGEGREGEGRGRRRAGGRG